MDIVLFIKLNYNYYMYDEDFKIVKDYFKKLQRTIIVNPDFKLFKVVLVKKNKIDDILCCIFAKLPDSYKKMLHSTGSSKFGSILSYNVLLKVIKTKFFLSQDLYVIDAGKAVRLIDTILKTLQNDIKAIDKL